MRCRTIARSIIACGLVLCSTRLPAAIKLPAVIGDNMVLQRDQPVPIWGWADKGEEVIVKVAGQTLTTKAGEDGRWKVVLAKLHVAPGATTVTSGPINMVTIAAKPAAGSLLTSQPVTVVGDYCSSDTPLEMTIRGSSGSTLTVKNILVGEVWVCAGQSNMEKPLGPWPGQQPCVNYKEEIAAAKHPNIRLFTVPLAKAEQPQSDCKGQWVECSPKTISARFTAVGYFFGRQLHKELNVPVGLIDSIWGGTRAEFWTSRQALEANPVLKPLAKGESSVLYNAMIAPLMPLAIRGAIWYQGESNIDKAYQYRTLFPAMIADWRANWGEGDFPFGFVQLAPCRYWKSDPLLCAELREAQSMTLKASPNTGMAVTMDVGDVKDIHPRRKRRGRPTAGPVGFGEGLRPQRRLFRADLQINGRRRRQGPS